MVVATAPKEAPAVLLGRYQLLAKIGEGGMGTVWRAFDLDLEEPVAVKFLREELINDPSLRSSFRREVKLARRVTHPNVARVFEFGQTGSQYFLTMEYIEGETLGSRLRRAGPLTDAQALALGVSLCRGLAAAHAVGVVHGDIKPGNILLARERGAVLTDFGIAHGLFDAPNSFASMAGTPYYMAPELFEGAHKSTRSDVYACGVVLFEALVGKKLWAPEDLTALKDLQVQPRADSLDELGPGWRELVASCVRGDPRLRPADARALLAQITNVFNVPTTIRQAPSIRDVAGRHETNEDPDDEDVRH